MVVIYLDLAVCGFLFHRGCRKSPRATAICFCRYITERPTQLESIAAEGDNREMVTAGDSCRRKTIPTTTYPSPPHFHAPFATLSRGILAAINRGKQPLRQKVIGNSETMGVLAGMELRRLPTAGNLPYQPESLKVSTLFLIFFFPEP